MSLPARSGMQSVQEHSPSIDGAGAPEEALGLLPLEARVVLLSAGSDQVDAILRDLLRQELDWPKLCGLAEREHASSVLWRRLTRLGCGGDEGALLQRLGMVAEFKLLRLQQRLYETNDALGAAGIEVVLLKGAAIAHTAYVSFPQRPMSDIDLLVLPEQAGAARDLLLKSGWMRSPYSRADEAYEGHQHLPPFADQSDSGGGLDLHTDLFFEGHPFRLSPSAIRARARQVMADQHVLLVPDLLHQLLHACIHFAYSHVMAHGAWRTFRDIAAIAGTGHIDWKEFVSAARESGAETSCYWTLRLARVAAGVAVPAHVIQDLSPVKSPGALRLLERHFTLGLLPTDARCPSVRMRNLLWQAGLFPEGNRGRPVRPWARLRRFRATSSQGGGGFLQGLPRHIRHAMASPRYVWGLLRGSPPP